MKESALQYLVDGWRVETQKERAGAQMTLGELIDRLRELPLSLDISPGLHNPHSYRGFYDDIAFEVCDPCTILSALNTCQAAMGEVYEGYKGGEFQMGRNTPVWVANYGCCGVPLLGIEDDGSLTLGKEE